MPVRAAVFQNRTSARIGRSHLVLAIIIISSLSARKSPTDRHVCPLSILCSLTCFEKRKKNGYRRQDSVTENSGRTNCRTSLRIKHFSSVAPGSVAPSMRSCTKRQQISSAMVLHLAWSVCLLHSPVNYVTSLNSCLFAVPNLLTSGRKGSEGKRVFLLFRSLEAKIAIFVFRGIC